LTLLNILHAGAIVVAINSYYIRQGQFIIFGVPLVLAWLLSFAWMLYHWLAERGTRQVLAYRQSFAAPTHDRDPRAEAYDDYSRLADDTYPDDADDEPLALDALLRKAKRE
ncbi:MAG: hypothetical protein JW910_05175, partial [Anaerolineae bacterium]|nr:hypothetical protein [Anaerolineae bacterium]